MRGNEQGVSKGGMQSHFGMRKFYNILKIQNHKMRIYNVKNAVL